MSSYLNSLRQTTNEATTENGAASNASTLDPMLDFFSRAGAMRADHDGVRQLFSRAHAADKRLALKALFYLRDIRGGQGERELFRTLLQWLEDNDLETLHKLLPLVAEYGRWDDLLSLRRSETLQVIAGLMKTQLEADEAAMKTDQSVSLLAKWMPSENASSRRGRTQARALAQFMGWKAPEYRKRLSLLRKWIILLEQQMSANEWEHINYAHLPSQAHRKHVKAFHRHDEERYSSYLQAVKKGEQKINAGTLFTYEVFDMLRSGHEDAANAMWENLPDFTQGKNALVMADVSGSMTGRPMDVSVSLALYFAERNKGPFNGYFMTFSDSPSMVQVIGGSLTQRLRNIENAEWGMSTNIEAAFRAILKAAVDSGASQDEMPAVLYIISDMEFNACVRNASDTNYNTAKFMFEEAGYKLPHVVFWNVDSRNSQVPATMLDGGVTLISGLSQSTFRYAVEGKSPLELMHEVLESERYAAVEV